MFTIPADAALLPEGSARIHRRSWFGIVGYTLLAGFGLLLGAIAGIAFSFGSGLVIVC